MLIDMTSLEEIPSLDTDWTTRTRRGWLAGHRVLDPDAELAYILFYDTTDEEWFWGTTQGLTNRERNLINIIEKE